LIKKIAIFLYLASRSLQRTSKLQENPSAIKKTSITSKIEVLFTILISFYEGHVCPSVSGSESTCPIWIRIKLTKTNADPASDPQYWLFLQSLRVSLKKTQIQKCRHLGNVQRCKELPPIPNAERNKQQFSLTALQIREILTRIRIHGSIPLTNGSGSGCGSCYLHPGPS
jgi:hypothetical protein